MPRSDLSMFQHRKNPYPRQVKAPQLSGKSRDHLKETIASHIMQLVPSMRGSQPRNSVTPSPHSGMDDDGSCSRPMYTFAYVALLDPMADESDDNHEGHMMTSPKRTRQTREVRASHSTPTAFLIGTGGAVPNFVGKYCPNRLTIEGTF